ncbi:hypothetical protein RKD48_000632 [Streptomyces ambofaciens]
MVSSRRAVLGASASSVSNWSATSTSRDRPPWRASVCSTAVRMPCSSVSCRASADQRSCQSAFMVSASPAEARAQASSSSAVRRRPSGMRAIT